MERLLVDPAHPAPTLEQAAKGTSAAAPTNRWERKVGDICHITLRAGGFLASSYLMALGMPLLFFLALSGGEAGALFAHLANMADRFLAADHARQAAFLSEIKLVLIGLATLLAVIRLPRFLRDLARELSGEKS